MREYIQVDVGGNELAIGDYVAYVYPKNSTMRYGRIFAISAKTVTVKGTAADFRGKKNQRISRDPSTQVCLISKEYATKLMLEGLLEPIELD